MGRSNPDCRSAAQHEYAVRSLFRNDPTYLTDEDHPNKAADAGLVCELFLRYRLTGAAIRTSHRMNLCMESEVVEGLQFSETASGNPPDRNFGRNRRRR